MGILEEQEEEAEEEEGEIGRGTNMPLQLPFTPQHDLRPEKDLPGVRCDLKGHVPIHPLLEIGKFYECDIYLHVTFASLPGVGRISKVVSRKRSARERIF